jgi:Cu2+-exporting ATPase
VSLVFFPDVFFRSLKPKWGTVHLYFEATTVILTLVLLAITRSQSAHSKTSGAIKDY